MMTFYAAAGSYQIRSEDGKNISLIRDIVFFCTSKVVL